MEECHAMENSVIGIIYDCIEPQAITSGISPETSVKSLLIDSLKMVQIVFEIEVHFGVEIPEHALFQIDTVRDLVDLVRLACAA